MVKYFMEEVDSTFGIDPAASNNYAIRQAAKKGHAEVVKYLKGLDTIYGIDSSLIETIQ